MNENTASHCLSAVWAALKQTSCEAVRSQEARIVMPSLHITLPTNHISQQHEKSTEVCLSVAFDR